MSVAIIDLHALHMNMQRRLHDLYEMYRNYIQASVGQGGYKIHIVGG